jgi:SET domain-containing protein
MNDLAPRPEGFLVDDGHFDGSIARYANPWIGVKTYANRGRGVIALRDIPAGELIERTPVLVIPDADRETTDRSIIFTYVYMWEHGTTEQDLYAGSGRAAIALGMSSLLNHSYNPNASFLRKIDELELELRSRTTIAAGEEVTIDYQMELWFEPQ